jgi:hypothetical protein
MPRNTKTALSVDLGISVIPWGCTGSQGYWVIKLVRGSRRRSIGHWPLPMIAWARRATMRPHGVRSGPLRPASRKSRSAAEQRIDHQQRRDETQRRQFMTRRGDGGSMKVLSLRSSFSSKLDDAI